MRPDKSIPFIYTALLLLTLMLTGCSRAREPYTATRFCLDTICSITVYDTEGEFSQKARAATDKAFDLCEDLSVLFDMRNPSGDIGRINSAHGESVTCSPQTAELLNKGLYYCSLSGGDFDLTIGRASLLWDFHGDGSSLPDENALKAAVSTIDYDNILINGDCVTLTDPDAAIDTGAIAKGYIADRICELLENEGVRSAIVNLGGNVCAIGEKSQGKGFSIGIEAPYSKGSGTAKVTEACNETLVTSGVYERYLEADGKQYHHVLSPHTGYPVETDLLSVTVRSRLGRSADCDALSTVCLIKGSDEALKLIEEIDGFEAFMITQSGEQLYTSGF